MYIKLYNIFIMSFNRLRQSDRLHTTGVRTAVAGLALGGAAVLGGALPVGLTAGNAMNSAEQVRVNYYDHHASYEALPKNLQAKVDHLGAIAASNEATASDVAENALAFVIGAELVAAGLIARADRIETTVLSQEQQGSAANGPYPQ
jgi:hypothetical protein